MHAESGVARICTRTCPEGPAGAQRSLAMIASRPCASTQHRCSHVSGKHPVPRCRAPGDGGVWRRRGVSASGDAPYFRPSDAHGKRHACLCSRACIAGLLSGSRLLPESFLCRNRLPTGEIEILRSRPSIEVEKVIIGLVLLEAPLESEFEKRRAGLPSQRPRVVLEFSPTNDHQNSPMPAPGRGRARRAAPAAGWAPPNEAHLSLSNEIDEPNASRMSDGHLMPRPQNPGS